MGKTLKYMKKQSQKSIAVIVGYYNGEMYFEEQLQSILSQTTTSLKVFISDDSSHAKLNLDKFNLSELDKKRVNYNVRQENVGFSRNFLIALNEVSDDFDFFAFSDQDDIWPADKLRRATDILEKFPSNKPALYAARTSITDQSGQINLGISPTFSKPPTFANALVQNIGGGNTMVFNKAARDLIVASSMNTKVISHDWWAYQIVSGSGGFVYFDKKPCLKYRQHANNIVGSNNNWTSRMTRLVDLLNGRFREWNNINLAALNKNKFFLTAENQTRLNYVIKARQSTIIGRVSLFAKSGIYRQTFYGNIGLLLGIIINKV
jgi:glycosyltransferase involved in cell wall biosynthesis